MSLNKEGFANLYIPGFNKTYENSKFGASFNYSISSLNLIEILQWGCLQLGNSGYNFSSCINLTLNNAQKRDINIAMSNTFGFGGHNACVIFKKYIN